MVMTKRKAFQPPRQRGRPRDRSTGASPGSPGSARSDRSRARTAGQHWIYGIHAVSAALANPKRRLKRLLVTAQAAERLASQLDRLLDGRSEKLVAERVSREQFAEILPEGAAHQGLALGAEPLEQPSLADLLRLWERPAGSGSPAAKVVLALDQVTDPQNVGAILRSASAFGAAAVLAPRHNAAPESAALVKAASGAFEHLPYVQVANLARALDNLKQADFRCFGLAAEAEATLAATEPGERLVLVLGGEERGLRRLTRERCDYLVRLPTGGPIGQLNVSAAAAVALYEILRPRAD